MVRVILLVLVSGVLLLACAQPVSEKKTAEPNTTFEETPLFLNIDLKAMQAAVRRRFSDVSGESYQGKTRRGEKGHLSMKGRRLQRFQLNGKIDKDARTRALDELEAACRAAVEAHGAAQVRIIEDMTLRPMMLPMLATIPVNLGAIVQAEGFALRYEADRGRGWIDALAVPDIEAGENEWIIALVIHERLPPEDK